MLVKKLPKIEPFSIFYIFGISIKIDPSLFNFFYRFEEELVSYKCSSKFLKNIISNFVLPKLFL